MRHLTLAAVVLSAAFAALPACGAKAEAPAKAAKVTLTTEEDKTLYALGQLIGKNVQVFGLTPKELEVVKLGLEDGILGKPAQVELEKYAEKVQELHGKRVAASSEKEKAVGTAFIEKAAAEKGSTKTASGIVVTELTPGSGAAPAATDEVKVHYEGKLIDGKVFDSSVKRGEPATFPLNGVIPCWTEALQLMKVGGKNRIVCPSELAYGERGSPPDIHGNATLIFEVELLDIQKKKG